MIALLASESGTSINLLGGTIDGVTGTISANSTLNSHFTQQIPADVLPEGKECVQVDGHWIVRDTLTEETAAAKVQKQSGQTVFFETVAGAAANLEEGDTLTLLRDATSAVIAKLNGSATIDLNGHSITDESAPYALRIEQGVEGAGTVTVKNSGAAATLSGSTAGLYATSSELGSLTLDYQPADITLAPSAGGIELGNARMADTSQNAALVTNGGFRATVGGTSYIYGTVLAATTDADAGTEITLLNDYSGSEPMLVSTDGTFVINLDGHTYSSSSECVAHVAWSKVDVTFKNGSIVSTSQDASSSIAGVYLGSTQLDGVTLTLEDVDLSMENSGNAGVIVQGNNTNNTVTLRGCTLTVPNDVMGVYFPPAQSTLNLIDTKITAGTGVGLKGGTLNISGSTEIHAKGANDPAGVPEGGGIAETGAAIYVDGGYVNREVAVNVQGGTFTSEQGSAIQELVSEDRPESMPVTIEVAGGSFDDASIAGYLTPNAAVVATADGTYDVYPTEDEALASGGAYRVEDAQGNVWFFRDAETAEQFATEQGTGSAVQIVSHTVTFHDCLESTEDAVVTVLNGDAVARPATDPTCEGHTFLGWYELVDGQYAAEPYDFATPVTGDLVLYAKWEKLPDGDSSQGDQVETPTDPDQKPSDEQKPGTDQQPAGEKGDQLAQTSDPTSAAPVVAAGLSGLAAIAGAVAARLRGRRRE